MSMRWLLRSEAFLVIVIDLGKGKPAHEIISSDS